VASACGAGSLAATDRPRDRKNAAQLAPIVPAPMTATWRMSALSMISSRASWPGIDGSRRLCLNPGASRGAIRQEVNLAPPRTGSQYVRKSKFTVKCR
jgi:hypothetical protein